MPRCPECGSGMGLVADSEVWYFRCGSCGFRTRKPLVYPKREGGLEDLVSALDRHSEALEEYGSALREHSEVLRELGEALEDSALEFGYLGEVLDFMDFHPNVGKKKGWEKDGSGR